MMCGVVITQSGTRCRRVLTCKSSFPEDQLGSPLNSFSMLGAGWRKCVGNYEMLLRNSSSELSCELQKSLDLKDLPCSLYLYVLLTNEPKSFLLPSIMLLPICRQIAYRRKQAGSGRQAAII